MKQIFIENVSISYEFLKHKKSDTLYVFLHGWGGSKKSLKKLSQKVYDQGHNILIFDFPGFGYSDIPPSIWNTHDYAKNFAKFLKTQNDTSIKKIVLYGHSFGCRIIVRYLTEFNFEKNITEIILTGAAGICLPLAWHKKCMKKIFPIFKTIKQLIPKKIQSFIRRKIFRAHDWDAVSGTMKKIFSVVIAEADFRETLKQIPLPATIIWGAKDTYTPVKASKIFAEYLPNVKKFEIFSNGKHGIHHTHTKEISQIIRSV